MVWGSNLRGGGEGAGAKSLPGSAYGLRNTSAFLYTNITTSTAKTFITCLGLQTRMETRVTKEQYILTQICSCNPYALCSEDKADKKSSTFVSKYIVL